MHPHQGRGAPEIDIFEVMPGHEMPGFGSVRPFMSNSLQISPGLGKLQRPTNGQPLQDAPSGTKWYDRLQYSPDRSELNYGFWGQLCGPEYDSTPTQKFKYQEDAISANTWLNSSHFEQHHIYRLEWQPPNPAVGPLMKSHGGEFGYLEWYLDGEFIFGIEGQSLEDLTGAMIPVEPMYLILNTAISHRWGMPEPCDAKNCAACWLCYDCINPECQCSLPLGMRGCKNLPAEMEIDYVRLYQDPLDTTHTVGCSPEGYPTAEYIEAHAGDYAPWRPASHVHVQTSIQQAVWRGMGGAGAGIGIGVGLAGAVLVGVALWRRRRMVGYVAIYTVEMPVIGNSGLRVVGTRAEGGMM